MQNQLKKLQGLVFQLQVILEYRKNPKGLNNREKLYYMAMAFIGKDASPNDIAPDELACAETVNEIHKNCFGFQIGGGVSTYRMYQALKYSPYFTMVTTPLRGDVIISPTGYGNGSIPGHVGIVGDNDVILSNDSKTGNFDTKHTIETWRSRYQQLGGFPIFFFRRI